MISDNSDHEKLKTDKKFYSGLQNHFSNLKRSWRMCPRCAPRVKRYTVDRLHRRCSNCGGALIFDGDDAKKLNEEHVDWYMWHKSPFNMVGWFHKSYFEVR